MLILFVAILILGILVLFAICVPKSRGTVFATFILLVGGGFIVGLVGTTMLESSSSVYWYDHELPMEEGFPSVELASADDAVIADLSETDHGTPIIELEGAEEVASHEPVSEQLSVHAGNDEVAELAEQNFQPVEEINLVLKRPDWVSSPPDEIDGQPAVVVQSGQWETTKESELDLLALVHAEAMRFATDAVYSNQADGPAEFPLSLNDLRQITRDKYEEEVETSVGPMKRVHRLIVFDGEFKGSLRDRYYQAAVEERLAQAGFMSGGVFLFLMTVFGFLKVSTRSSRKEAR